MLLSRIELSLPRIALRGLGFWTALGARVLGILGLMAMWHRARLRSTSKLRNFSTAVRRHIEDEGDWFYSSEWWGDQSDGHTVLRSTSDKGNGVVSVVAHHSSRPVPPSTFIYMCLLCVYLIVYWLNGLISIISPQNFECSVYFQWWNSYGYFLLSFEVANFNEYLSIPTL